MRKFDLILLPTTGTICCHFIINIITLPFLDNYRNGEFSKLFMRSIDNIDKLPTYLPRARTSHRLEAPIVPFTEVLKALKCFSKLTNLEYNVDKWINITETAAYKDNGGIRIFGATLTFRRASTG